MSEDEGYEFFDSQMLRAENHELHEENKHCLNVILAAGKALERLRLEHLELNSERDRLLKDLAAERELANDLKDKIGRLEDDALWGRR